MTRRNAKAVPDRILWALGLLLVVSQITRAERLPIKSYTTADGLAHNVVNKIVRDSRGFLWFCTREGLSRFDGYSFTNYGIRQGLPSANVNDLLETREGVYWVATAGGLCRFNPLGKPQARINHTDGRSADDAMFSVDFTGDDARSKYVSSLLQDRSGVIWCGTQNGLYRLDLVAGEATISPVDLGIPDYLESRIIESMIEDRRGALWIGSHSGLYRRWQGGQVEAYTIAEGLRDNFIHSLLEDHDGRIWVGTRSGALCRLVPDPSPKRNIVARAYSDRDGLPTPWISQLFQSSDGGLWAGSTGGLIQFMPTADGREFRFRAYTQVNGLSYREVGSLAEDRNGNLWLALAQGGVAKIARSGFTTFDKSDGLSWTTSIFETEGGDLVVFGGPDIKKEGFINRFDGEKFIPISLQFRGILKKQGRGWGWNQTVLEDHTGDWWIATRGGVYRFPKVTKLEQLTRISAKATYTTRDGLASDVILRLFEDSRGDIWIGSVGEGRGPSGLSRWARSTGAFRHYAESDNLPRLDSFYISSFAEDRGGDVWIGFSAEGGLVRYRDGRFMVFTANDGVPLGSIRNMLVDSSGRLWAATYRGGLCRIDDPAAAHPRIVTYTTEDGLSSNEITTVSEDEWGWIYIGTGRGIDKLDPATGSIKHYTTADGLPLGELYSSLRDRNGRLWFGFETGTARLVPKPNPSPVPPPILITGLRIAGDERAISALGETYLASTELSADKSQLQIDFVALGFSPGEGLRYQYLLEGANEQWSKLADQRTVNFANLAPGRYRFLVRAVNSDGVFSEAPARFSFTILPPFWQRWWFIAIVTALVGLIAYVSYRTRVARLLELERVRTRIAADLHDDIGSNLSQIAIWSDVAQRQAAYGDVVERGRAADQAAQPLERIAVTARETAAAMSDIVWAINPRRDHLNDLISRMRRFAGEAFDSRDIVWLLDAPQMNLSLNADTRRELFLIFKESVNNILRHAHCTRVETSITIEASWLRLRISDDGRGFDPHRRSEGQGLDSMRGRAQNIGGVLEVESAPGSGTTVQLEMPFNQYRWWHRRLR